jgi:DNA-binding transcriptional LysR family regulator
VRNDLGELAAFAVVAQEKSFTRAASRLGVSQSALSHMMRGLERRLGLQLLARTTRSVSPTPAGNALLADLSPALDRIEHSLAEARKQRDRPSGRIRLVISRTAAQLVLLPKLASFTRTYPDVLLDVTASNDPVDLVSGEFDAGIQIGELIQRDMIAVRVSQDMRLICVASPNYLKKHGTPRLPGDLKDHSCIAFRFRTGVYRWEFEKGRKTLTVNPKGPLIFDDPELVIQAAILGIGVGMAMEASLVPFIEKNQLVEVLNDWSPKFPGFFLYYPSRRNQPVALAALIQTLRS